MTTATEVAVYARIIKPYTMAYPDPLELEPGDKVSIVAHDTQYPAFVWCTSSDGKGGWVPESYLRHRGADGWALRQYSAHELTVSTGEELHLLDEEGGWYWAENALGERGWVPVEHVAVL